MSQNNRPRTLTRQRNLMPVAAPSASTSRRRKSRSPDSRPVSTGQVLSAVDSANAKKKKKGGFTMWPHRERVSSPQATNSDEMMLDRGRKSKAKSIRSQVRPENAGGTAGRQGGGQAKAKKERSASRDSPRHSKAVSPAPTLTEDEGVGAPAFSGPLAAAEFVRLRAENEALKKQLHTIKKTLGKHKETMEEVKQELTAANKSRKEQGQQMEKLKTKSKKSEDLLTSIENNLQCQICLEYLVKPFALSPCGHVYCQGCLQNWFRSAPPSENDMADDEDPDYLLYRHKSCPSCRACVRMRPIPLFLVKAIASAIAKSKLPPSQANRPSPPPEADPWAGIFPTNEELEDEDMFDDDMDDDDDEDEEDGESEDSGFDAGGMWAALPGYGTDSDEEPYEGEFVEPRWQPPTVWIDPDNIWGMGDEDDDMLALLRRGATLGMIEMYAMEYSHEHGITAMLDGENTVYLGWNIHLHENDLLGEMYMNWIATDIFDRPDRWRVHHDHRELTWEAWKLVPEDDVIDYDTTDSEAYHSDED